MAKHTVTISDGRCDPRYLNVNVEDEVCWYCSSPDYNILIEFLGLSPFSQNLIEIQSGTTSTTYTVEGDGSAVGSYPYLVSFAPVNGAADLSPANGYIGTPG